MILTVTLLSLNLTENLQGEETKGKASALIPYAHIFMLAPPSLLEANTPSSPEPRSENLRRQRLGWGD